MRLPALGSNPLFAIYDATLSWLQANATLPVSDDYYIKPICPSGGHDRGHRLALQNRAAARNVPLTLKTAKTYLATDDAAFGANFSSSMRARGIDVVFAPDATAFDDLCALSHSKLIIKASTTSQFSSMAAALGAVPMLSFAFAGERAGRSIERTWVRDGLLVQVTHLQLPVV